MKNFVILLIVFGLFACSKNPYRQTNKAHKKQTKEYAKVLSAQNQIDNLALKYPEKWVGTTNFNMRKPNFVIIHHTAQNSCEQTLKTFTLPRTSVSAHYVICKDGTVHHMLNDYLRAWHAGVGKWGNDTDINSASIGIEIDNNGFEEFSVKQMEALETLLAHLKTTYRIPAANFIGHADIAPTRKNDPNIKFEWKSIADKGFGTWYGDTTHIAVPTSFDPMLGLRMIGYDISDSAAVVSTFKRKYLQREDKYPLSANDVKVLYALWLEALK